MSIPILGENKNSFLTNTEIFTVTAKSHLTYQPYTHDNQFFNMARSPRPPKSGRHSPATAEAQKQLWQDPEYHHKIIAARHRSAEDRRNDPHHYSRLGIPNGWRKEDAMEALTQAHDLKVADTMIKDFEQQGILPEIVIPDSDKEIAKSALREACLLSPDCRGGLP
jgi:hypothetical protein